MDQPPNNLAAYCWSIADLLRGDFKQSQYGRIILPFTLLRRLECVLQDSKDKVLAEYERLQTTTLPEEAHEKFLLRASGISFYNTSAMDLSKLGQNAIKENLENYIQNFSRDAREIFEYFNFAEFIGQLNDADLLFEIVKKVKATDLSLNAVSNHDMGLVFEELIRRFAESSNETAGEHFTPRDIVHLTTSLVFMEDDDALTKEGIVRTIYDPTAGTGGFLSSGMEYVHELNPQAVIKAFGQELNPESYSICKADMLIKGQEVNNIKLGNTLSNDQLYGDKFDYMLSNPPFGVDWKKIVDKINEEHDQKGFDGRFGAGLPRVSDGSLLFLLHLISKLRDTPEGGGRIGIILNGSPLFTGGAGSGESEIRRYILEADLLETIVALPTDMFYNTGIATYVWVLSNKKAKARKGKVQLINGVNLCGKMRKSLGSKRNEMSSDDIATITRTFGAFEVVDARELDKPAEQKSNRGRQSANPKTEAPKTFASKIFATHEFGYRRITIERPLRESYQFSDERIAELRFAPKPLNAAMKWVYETYGDNWNDEEGCEHYGVLAEQEAAIRKQVKAHFTELKEAKVKDLLNVETWEKQKHVLLKAKQLQAAIGTEQHDDMNDYEARVKAACQSQKISLDTAEKKQILAAVSWINPDAERVIKKVHKNTEANPHYGLFDVAGKTLEYKPDGNLRDHENVALDPSQSVNDLNEAYFAREVQPHVPDAWIDASKTDEKDEEVGVVGYELNWKRYFPLGKERLRGSGLTNKLRCKNIFTQNSKGRYVLNLVSLKLSSTIPSNLSRSLRVDVNRNILNPDYFNYFIQTPVGEAWVDSVSPDSTLINNTIPTSKFMTARLPLPALPDQNEIVRLNDDYIALLAGLETIESVLLQDHLKFEQLLAPHLNATQRYQDEFQHILPHPLAVLWVQAESAVNNKDACDCLCKFYEYLGFYLVSIVFNFMEHDEVLRKLQRKNGKPIALTMGDSYNILRSFAESPSDEFPDGMKIIYSAELVELLEEATGIRNDIVHRGLTSGQESKEKLKLLEDINERMQHILRGFFVNYTMFTPVSSTYDGRKYEYGVDYLDGLALNPCAKGTLLTEIPLVDEQLYIAFIKPDELSNAYPLYPLVLLDETIDESEFKAFYFYSDWIQEGAQKDYSLRFVCPYPNVKMYKTKELKALGLKNYE